MSQLINLLNHDEFFSPLAFVVLGGLSLLFAWSTNARVSRVPPFNPWLEKIAQRFAERQTVSWILLGFGTLWGLQIVVDRLLAS